MIRGIFTLFLIFVLFPFCLGNLFGLKRNIDKYLVGFATMHALYLPVYLLAYIRGMSLSASWWVYIVIMTVMSVVSVYIYVFKNRRMGINSRGNQTKNWEKSLFINSILDWLKNPYFIIAMLLISLQLVRNIIGEPYIYGDDSFYITYVTKIWEKNSFASSIIQGSGLSYGLSYKHILTSYYKWLSGMTYFTGIHPLIFCKTILALVHLFLQYLVVWRIADVLFDKDSRRIMKQSIFMMFYAFLIEWGYISYYTFSRRVLLWIWNSKSICFCILLPLLAFFLYHICVESKDNCGDIFKKKNFWTEMMSIFAITVAAGAVSIMGIMLSSIMIFLYGCIAIFYNRNFKCILTVMPAIVFNIVIVAIIWLNHTGRLSLY